VWFQYDRSGAHLQAISSARAAISAAKKASVAAAAAGVPVMFMFYVSARSAESLSRNLGFFLLKVQQTTPSNGRGGFNPQPPVEG